MIKERRMLEPLPTAVDSLAEPSPLFHYFVNSISVTYTAFSAPPVALDVHITREDRNEGDRRPAK